MRLCVAVVVLPAVALIAGSASGTMTYVSATRVVSAGVTAAPGASFQATDLLSFSHSVGASEQVYGTAASASQSSMFGPSQIDYFGAGSATRGLAMSSGVGASNLDVRFTLDGPTPLALSGTWFRPDSQFEPRGRVLLTSESATIFDNQQDGFAPSFPVDIPYSFSGIVPAGGYRLQVTMNVFGASSFVGGTTHGSMRLAMTVPSSPLALIVAGGVLLLPRRRCFYSTR